MSEPIKRIFRLSDVSSPSYGDPDQLACNTPGIEEFIVGDELHFEDTGPLLQVWVIERASPFEPERKRGAKVWLTPEQVHEMAVACASWAPGRLIDLDSAGFDDLVAIARRLLDLYYPADLFPDRREVLLGTRDRGAQFVVHLRRALDALEREP